MNFQPIKLTLVHVRFYYGLVLHSCRFFWGLLFDLLSFSSMVVKSFFILLFGWSLAIFVDFLFFFLVLRKIVDCFHSSYFRIHVRCKTYSYSICRRSISYSFRLNFHFHLRCLIGHAFSIVQKNIIIYNTINVTR